MRTIYGLVLTMMWATLSCKSSCQKQASEAARAASGCRLLRVLGQKPRWGLACEHKGNCWRQGKGRMAWARCIDHRCLLGSQEPKRGHIRGVSALWMGHLRGHGAVVISGDLGGDLRLWDARTGSTQSGWRAHKGALRAVAVTSQGWLLTAGDDEVIRLWWPRRKLLIGLWKVRGRISSLALSAGDRWLAAASTDRAVWLRKLELPKAGALPKAGHKGRWRRLLGHKDAVRSVAFDASGQKLLSASDDRSLRLWSPVTGKSLRVFKGHRGWVRRGLFGGPPTKPWIVSGSFDTSLLLWDLSGQVLERWGEAIDVFASAKKPQLKARLRALSRGHKSDISDLAVSSDGRWILATGHRSSLLRLPDDGTTARLWSRKEGRVLCHLKGHMLGLTRAAFAPKGRRFATASEDGTVRVYEVAP